MRDKLLHDAARAGLYSLPAERRPDIEERAASLRLKRFHVDAASCPNSRQLLAQLGDELGFPAWYGGNFDALFDCLSDADWQPAKGHLLVFTGLESLRLADPEGFATLVEVLQAVADTRRDNGKPFWITIDTPAPGVPALPEA